MNEESFCFYQIAFNLLASSSAMLPPLLPAFSDYRNSALGFQHALSNSGSWDLPPVFSMRLGLLRHPVLWIPNSWYLRCKTAMFGLPKEDCGNSLTESPFNIYSLYRFSSYKELCLFKELWINIKSSNIYIISPEKKREIGRKRVGKKQ